MQSGSTGESSYLPHVPISKFGSFHSVQWCLVISWSQSSHVPLLTGSFRIRGAKLKEVTNNPPEIYWTSCTVKMEFVAPVISPLLAAWCGKQSYSYQNDATAWENPMAAIGLLSLVGFWCPFVPQKASNNTLVPQNWLYSLCWQRSAKFVQSSSAALQHCFV